MQIGPVPGLIGLGFMGYGIAAPLGGGIALIAPMTLVLAQAPWEAIASVNTTREKRSWRHNYYLWRDRRTRRREWRAQKRRERNEGERRYLASRKGRQRSMP